MIDYKSLRLIIVRDSLTCLHYRLDMVNLNTVNLKFHLIQCFFEIFARFLLFQIYNAQLIQTWII